MAPFRIPPVGEAINAQRQVCKIVMIYNKVLCVGGPAEAGSGWASGCAQ